MARARRRTDGARTSHRIRHKLFRHARDRRVRGHNHGLSTLPPGARRVDPWDAHRRSRPAGADSGAALHQRRPRRSLANDDAHRGLCHRWVARRRSGRLTFTPRGTARHGLRAAGCRRVHDARYARSAPGGRHRARIHTTGVRPRTRRQLRVRCVADARNRQLRAEPRRVQPPRDGSAGRVSNHGYTEDKRWSPRKRIAFP